MRFLTFLPLAVLFVVAVLGVAVLGVTEAEQPVPVRGPEVPAALATEYPLPEPVLHAIFRGEPGTSGRVLFTVYDPEENIVIEDAAGPVVQPGADSTYTIPAGTLEDGVLYTWTARAVQAGEYSAFAPANVVSTTDVSSPAFALDVSSRPRRGMVMPYYNDPYNCRLRLPDRRHGGPHASRHEPSYIAAQARTVCGQDVPPATIIVEQELARSSWRGWIVVATNRSVCDNGRTDPGQSEPLCRPYRSSPRMIAYVRWDCVGDGYLGHTYNYRHRARGEMYVGGVGPWRAYESMETGPRGEPGNVTCGDYLLD